MPRAARVGEGGFAPFQVVLQGVHDSAAFGPVEIHVAAGVDEPVHCEFEIVLVRAPRGVEREVLKAGLVHVARIGDDQFRHGGSLSS